MQGRCRVDYIGRMVRRPSDWEIASQSAFRNAFSFIFVPSPFSNLLPLLQSQPNASKIEAWKRNRYLALLPNFLLRSSPMRLSA
jgi:hypothetical protein